MHTTKYFNGNVELFWPYGIPKAEFLTMGGIPSKHNYFDSFSRLAGKDANGVLRPVDRTIHYKKRPSLHKCDARCRNGKGHTCECQCGGVNHGRDA